MENLFYECYLNIFIDKINVKAKSKQDSEKIMASLIQTKKGIIQAADSFDVTYDFDPEVCFAAILQANSGSISRQSRMGQEIIEKDDDIRQAWGTRIAALSGLEWGIDGDPTAAKEAEAMLKDIRPGSDSGLMSFWELLQSLQSANLHGFSLAGIEWAPGGSSIIGFRPINQAACRIDKYSDMPVLTLEGGGDLIPAGPGWLYHRIGDKAVSVCRVGLVRPLAWNFCFKRATLLGNVRFLEKFGMPIPLGKLPAHASDEATDDTGETEVNKERRKFEDAVSKMGAEGWMITPEGWEVSLLQPTMPSGNQYQDFLNYSSKKASRLILGQDSTSSAENSNRATAEVHDLVRKDILISDAMSVQQSITQILTSWSMMKYGHKRGLEFYFPITRAPAPAPAVKAQLLGAATAAGFTLSPEGASSYLGIPGLIAKPAAAPAPQPKPEKDPAA